MLFNSLQFAIFFPAVTLLYFVLPHRFRWMLLLTASCFFYMAFIPAYILILAVTIFIDYFAALQIAKSSGKRKSFYLVVSIAATCLVLFIFKYFNFFNSNFAGIAAFFHWKYPIEIVSIILPIGLSFHTFQSLSYVIEVYRGNQAPERHFGIYSLYVMFFPQLVAGPIERPQNLLHQFREQHRFEYARVANGLKLIAWGLFKKMVIADHLAIVVNQVYGNPAGFSGPALIIATVFFAFQIYCDFSGYSDIAIGCAQVLGFRLMDNFNRPYFSKSVSEFWTRWHISLSTWFRDYLYIPLGGNRVPKWRWQFNLLITFLVSGLWHGANWTYVLWGGLNGFYLVFSIWTKPWRDRLRSFSGLEKHPRLLKIGQILVTFSLICFAWIFFRAQSISDAGYIVSHLFSHFDRVFSFGGLKATIGGLGLSKWDFVLVVLSLLFMEIVQRVHRHEGMRAMLSGRPAWVRWSAYYVTVILVAYFGATGGADFIYFQF